MATKSRFSTYEHRCKMVGVIKTYSLDLLRERALAAVDRGMPRKEAVGVLGVSLATIRRWLKRREETGSAAPKRRPGMRRRVGATVEERRALWRQLEENREATLEEHRGGCGSASEARACRWPR